MNGDGTAGPAPDGGAWRPDPSGRHELRWWDGEGWSDQVADGGVVATDDLDVVPEALEDPGARDPGWVERRANRPDGRSPGSHQAGGSGGVGGAFRSDRARPDRTEADRADLVRDEAHRDEAHRYEAVRQAAAELVPGQGRWDHDQSDDEPQDQDRSESPGDGLDLDEADLKAIPGSDGGADDDPTTGRWGRRRPARPRADLDDAEVRSKVPFVIAGALIGVALLIVVALLRPDGHDGTGSWSFQLTEQAPVAVRTVTGSSGDYLVVTLEGDVPGDVVLAALVDDEYRKAFADTVRASDLVPQGIGGGSGGDGGDVLALMLQPADVALAGRVSEQHLASVTDRRFVLASQFVAGGRATLVVPAAIDRPVDVVVARIGGELEGHATVTRHDGPDDGWRAYFDQYRVLWGTEQSARSR